MSDNESFEEAAHRVLEEHGELRVQQVERLLEAGCTCRPKHTAAMVIRSTQACAFADGSLEVHVLDAVVWALDDIHATLFPDHETERLN